MTRLLLTLLALLTGLVAQASPAQPRMGDAAGAEVAAQLSDCGSRAIVASLDAARTTAKPVWQPGTGIFQATYSARPIQSVLPGIDRAHE